MSIKQAIEALEELVEYAEEAGFDWSLDNARAAVEASTRALTQGEPVAIAAPGVAQGWQPIESAPRDGKPVLLGVEPDAFDPEGYVGQGRWYEAEDDGCDEMGHDAGFMDERFARFSWGRSFGSPNYLNQGVQPTHWMPLPAAPSPTAEQPTPIDKAELKRLVSLVFGEGFEIVRTAPPVTQSLTTERPPNCGWSICSCIECPFGANNGGPAE